MTVPTFWSGDWSAALVNHLWQSTVVVGIAWLLAWALRRNHARARYWVWFAASVKFLVPFSLLIAAGERLQGWIATQVAAKPALANAMEEIAQPFAGSQVFGATGLPSATHHANALPVFLLAVWACGAVVVAIRFVGGWRKVYAAKRAATRTSNRRSFDCAWRGNAPGSAQDDKLSLVAQDESAVSLVDSRCDTLGIAVGVPMLCSPTLMEPGIFGIFRPVLLLPEGIIDRLTAKQLRSIVAHELAHVRRRDNMTFALHMLVETLFWFYPLVWWVGKRLIDEREQACDEAVVEAGGGAQDYAEGILNVCKFCIESPLECVAGVTGADLKRRIARIMTQRLGTPTRPGGKMLLAAAALVVVAGPVSFGLLHALQANMPLLHEKGGERRSFEVATIKPNVEDKPGFNLSMNPAHFVAKHVSVNNLLSWAYYTKSDDQILGRPSWTKTKFFDIEAKASDADIVAINKMSQPERIVQSRLLVQSLLAERFHLQVSFKTEGLPVYALVVASGGPKIKEVQATTMPPGTLPGTSPPPGAHYSRIARSGPNQYTAEAWPMNLTADWLSRFDEVGNRPVVDKTGLKSTYDFVLNGVSMQPTTDESVTSIFTALQEQLGLKLEPQKAPVEVLVIDHVENPSPN